MPPVLFSDGFRPFFLLACAGAIAAMLPLPLVWLAWLPATGPLPSGLWHAHEQIFGFLCAALAGFLLTALPAWTGAPAAGPRTLRLLVGLWLAGRLALWTDGLLPAGLVALLDLAFLPALLAVCLPALRATANRPYDLLAALAGLIAANAAFHAGRMGAIALPPEQAVGAALVLFMLLITLALGRILPVTLRSALVETGQPPQVRLLPGRRHLAALCLVLLGAAELAAPGATVTAWLALAAACAQLDRMGELHRGAALRRPQVALFYLAQGWMALGLAGMGLASLLAGPMEVLALRHGLAAGAAGTTALTVMSVVALRHTGRSFPLPALVWLPPTLAGLATLLRVAVPLLAPAALPVIGVALAGLLWSAAFAAWLLLFGRWLLEPPRTA